MSPVLAPDLAPSTGLGGRDTVRLSSGLDLTIRPLAWPDAESLQEHVRNLSVRSRHNRYLGGFNELSRAEIARIIGNGEGPVFGLISDLAVDGRRIMVAEAVYAVDPQTGATEFALSVADDWQGNGIGAALVASIECRSAAACSALVHGETLRGNEPLLALAAKTGFAVVRHPGDPRLIRIEKTLVSVADVSSCGRLDQMRLALAA